MDRCSHCGTTYAEILETGFVGCENCYKQIDSLRAAVDRLTDGKKYSGKRGANGGI